MIRKSKQQQMLADAPPRPHLIDFSDAQSYPTFDKASLVLAGINGGFQRFVVARPDGRFVAVVMLLPTEFTPDIRNHVERYGGHVMLGISHSSVDPTLKSGH